MSTVSACLVVHNEEGVIERCLRSLDGVVDEIVLIHDGPCTDRTLEIADRFGAKITVVERVGNGEPHRPRSYALAAGEWILRIDADEYLSDELRAEIRKLAARTDADGWEFTWPIWSHEKNRYVTRNGPYKVAMTRRAVTMRLGLPGTHGVVRGTVRRVPLLLEHRPLFNHYRFRGMRKRLQRRARIHARVYLMNWEDIPQFGYPPDTTWPTRRAWGNRLSPLLIAPYGAAEFATTLWLLRRMRPARKIVAIAANWSLYAMLVQVYVVKYRYFERSAGRVPAGIQPARFNAE